MTYFSERENGERPRDNEDIDEGAWGGIQALIFSRIEDGSFGAYYPENCADSPVPIGSDESRLWQAMRAEIPTLQQSAELNHSPWYSWGEEPPQTTAILDMIEFCWRCVGKPDRIKYHSYLSHYHLRFNVEAGRGEFRNNVNRIFLSNGLAYELTEQGNIERLAAPVLREELAAVQFDTGEAELDLLLETARQKFLDPAEAVRREALEALWDAWERLKTLDSGLDKKAQVTSLLDDTAGSSSPKFRTVLEKEAQELTSIGNAFRIRHSETSQERLAEGKHVDYLFHRLLSLVQLILRMKGRV